MAYVNDEHICDFCGRISDDGLTTVVVEPAEKMTRDCPGYDAVVADWCAGCVENEEFYATVRDDDDEREPDWEADAYDRV
jgi:hypothetical protein